MVYTKQRVASTKQILNELYWNSSFGDKTYVLQFHTFVNYLFGVIIFKQNRLDNLSDKRCYLILFIITADIKCIKLIK